jgi:hypothetical protein
LEGCDLDEEVENASEFLSALLDGEASSLESDLTHCVFSIFEFLETEVGDENTGNVFLRFIESYGGSFDSFCYFSSK